MKWHKGPPPEIGWWPASINEDPQSIRWWNGKFWSCSCFPEESSEIAKARAATKDSNDYADRIKWVERWWEDTCSS